MLTNAEFAILSLVAEQSRHGYELEKIIEARGMREWTEIGFSSIYYILKKLQAAGLIAVARGSGKGGETARKVYAITSAGTRACAEMARRVLAEPAPSYPPVLLGLASSPMLTRQEMLAALAERRLRLDERLAEVKRQRAKQSPLPDFVEAIFGYSVTLLRAERKWLSETSVKWEQDMEKIDFRKEMKTLYGPSAKEFSSVDVPPMRYLMIDGSGNPNTSASYQESVEALYGVAYALKFASKKELGKDYVVPPLEGLWWAEDMTSFTRARKDDWQWTMMIMVPEWITPAMIETAKKQKQAPAVLRHEVLREGRCIQILHVGSYDDEGPVLKRLHEEYLPAHKLVETGKHHEIYLGDPRKTAPEKLKTVLRQPVKPR